MSWKKGKTLYEALINTTEKSLIGFKDKLSGTVLMHVDNVAKFIICECEQ